MTLIDTSSLIHLLRKKGDPLIKKRVSSLIAADLAAICPMIVTELYMGASTKEDKDDVGALCSLLHHLEIHNNVWSVAYKLASFCRNQGTPVPGSDVLIAACAFYHNVNIDSEDHHFNVLLNYKSLL
ncbi:MAG: PIN domain-containing protein [Verrucomicrobiota bacterium]